MNDKSARQVLDRIARKRTAQQADLWPRIEAQIQPQPRPQSRRRITLSARSAAIVIAVIAALLLVGTGTYAFYHFSGEIPDFDRGLQHVQSDDLGVELGLRQTIDGVTVTLDWVYADAHRIVILYSAIQENARQIPLQAVANARLFGSDGVEFRPIFGGGGGGGGGGSGGGGGGEAGVSQEATVALVWSLSGSMNFDAAEIAGAPSVLDLSAEIVLTLDMPPAGDSPDADSPPPSLSVGPFVFDFRAPFTPAVIVGPHQTVTAGGVPLTLERMSITPSSSEARLCLAAVGQGQDWKLVALLDTGRTEVKDFGFLGLPPAYTTEGNRSCAEIDFLAPYDQRPARWTLTISRLQLSPSQAFDGPWMFDISVPAP